MATAEKLNYLLETKNQIKNAIEGKGVSISDTDSFRSYASKIGQIESGGEDGNVDEYFANNVSRSDYIIQNLIKKIPSSTMSIIREYVKTATNISSMFHNCTNLTELDLSDFNTSNVSNMSYMFYNCTNLTELDLRNLNTSNVTNMSYMFYNCTNLTELDLSNFNTSNVTNIMNLTGNCKNLVNIFGELDLSGKGQATPNMFIDCGKLETIYIKNLEWTGFRLDRCVKLSHNSIMYLLNNLIETESTKILTLGTTNLAKLTDEEKAIATEKNWTLS